MEVPATSQPPVSSEEGYPGDGRDGSMGADSFDGIKKNLSVPLWQYHGHLSLSQGLVCAVVSRAE